MIEETNVSSLDLLEEISGYTAQQSAVLSLKLIVLANVSTALAGSQNARILGFQDHNGFKALADTVEGVVLVVCVLSLDKIQDGLEGLTKGSELELGAIDEYS